MNKRGLSPVIATVLLIAVVIILAIIIFLWAGSFFGERVEKFGKSEDQACSEVSIDVDYDAVTKNLDIINRGDVPIYGIKLMISGRGRSDVEEYPAKSINEGESGTIEDLDVSGDKITVIPILLGKSGGIKKSFTCDEKYGKEIIV